MNYFSLKESRPVVRYSLVTNILQKYKISSNRENSIKLKQTSEMFNILTLKIMKISMKIFSCMGSHLYEWNNSDDDVSCFKVTSKLWRKITFFIGFSSTVLYYCFLIWRLIQYSNQLESDPSFPDIVWLWIWIILTTWAIVSFYNGWTKKREVVAHFKGVTLLMKQLERGEYFPQIKLEERLL